ncbi:polysaccharide deacetylase family protein [Niallia sp. 03133]|uniref:polysaccharide deacetylase family protein n=1 Tax=Niallia sp. 03133 TaxID=3458060 RepID=UPI00404510B8
MGECNDSKVKASISLCFDVDGDTIWKLRAANYPQGETFLRSLSVGEYGVRRGVDRVLDLLAKYSFKATFFIPANVMKSHPKLVEKMMQLGHEVAHHGLGHEYHYGDTFEEQLAYIEQCQSIFHSVTGRLPVGFRPTGRLLPETIEYLEENNVKYLISEKGNEIPKFKEIEGKKLRIVELPSRIEFDDYYQLSYNYYPEQPGSQDRIANYSDVLENMLAELKGMALYGKSAVTAFHPQVFGSPGKSLILEELLRFLANQKEIYVCTCEEQATHFLFLSGVEGEGRDGE